MGGIRGFYARVIADERGQALPWMVLLIVLFLGIAGLSVDLGHAYICYRELQYSTDAAALAGGYNLALSTSTTASVTAAATAYSSVSPGVNVNSGLPSTSISVVLACSNTLKTEGVLCNGPTGDNVLAVKQTTTIPTYFIRALSAFGVKSATSMTLSAVSYASMRGSVNSQYNVALVIDTTKSMGDPDADGNCSGTRLDCAEQGMQTLLQALTPCTASTAGQTSCTGFDNVGIFTFPNIQYNTATDDTTCTSNSPTTLNYSTPVPGATWTPPTGAVATYEITAGGSGASADGFYSNYSSTGLAGGALAPASGVVIAAGGSTTKNCAGMGVTTNGKSTYLPGAIYAAQSALAAEQKLNPGSLNALIILSDGDQEAPASDMTATNGETVNKVVGTYPSSTDECQQGITAAKYATTAGTTVYVVAYGASVKGGNSGCTTDTTGTLAGISPCTELQDMASASADFFSDATTANGGACTSSANPDLTLAEVFKQVATNFTVSRLISPSAY